MRFDPPLPWQASMWARMQEARAAGRLAHALLLAGAAGVGKRSFARRLAASLLCESSQPDGQACGQCRGCTQVLADTHPNLSWLTREFNDKTDKEKRDISMEQLRAMMDRLSLSSHYGRARVVVIDPVEALNTSGINAVLKTVEEPPQGLYLLLISERPMALAPTLRSRCQRLNFPLPDSAQALSWLQSQLPGQDLSDALRDAGGAPLAALAARESGLLDQRRLWREAMFAVADRRQDPLIAAAAVGKDTVAEWLRNYLGVLHQMLRALAGADAEAAVLRLASGVHAVAIEALLAEVVEAQRRLQSNANPQLLIESLMISWWRRMAPSAVARR